jgi:hypothetical protein
LFALFLTVVFVCSRSSISLCKPGNHV